ERNTTSRYVRPCARVSLGDAVDCSTGEAHQPAFVTSSCGAATRMETSNENWLQTHERPVVVFHLLTIFFAILFPNTSQQTNVSNVSDSTVTFDVCGVFSGRLPLGGDAPKSTSVNGSTDSVRREDPNVGSRPEVRGTALTANWKK